MPLTLAQKIGIKFRGGSVRRIARVLATAEEQDLPLTADQIETRCLARGNIEAVAAAMLRARELGIAPDFNACCAIDLAGHDPVAEVEWAARHGLDRVRFPRPETTSREA